MGFSGALLSTVGIERDVYVWAVDNDVALIFICTKCCPPASTTDQTGAFSEDMYLPVLISLRLNTKPPTKQVRGHIGSLGRNCS